MRKLLLGSTAVAAAALFATGAFAQTPAVSNVIIGPGAGNAWSGFADVNRPNLGGTIGALGGVEVRLGGFVRAYYGYNSQSYRSSNQGAGGIGAGAANGAGSIRIGNSDFFQETEIHIVANGKAANGLRYGAALEIENDQIVQVGAVNANGGSLIGSAAANGTGSPANKNTITLDESWVYVQGAFGQVRFGDEDPALALMATGHITNFASGGLDGDFYDVLVGANGGGARVNLGMPSDNGDNTKIIYMTPQFFGFDAGASFAFNTGEADREGCIEINNQCDRLAATPGGLARRRNEVTGVVRWRGSFGPIGAAAHVGYMGADGVKNSAAPANVAVPGNAGISPERMNLIEGGAQFTAFGFTVGARGFFGHGNVIGGNVPLFPDRAVFRRDDRNAGMLSAGASYTIDALTVGVQAARVNTAGNQTYGTGARREQAINAGITYRIAPGLEAIAEYTYVERRERGYDFVTGGTGVAVAGGQPGAFTGTNTNNMIRANVVLAGLRMHF